jgi:hypothetical protein
MSPQSLLDQYEALRALRDPNLSIWQDLANICFPRRAGLHALNRAQPVNGRAPDRSGMAEQWDGTAMRACHTLATGQAARITPMGGRWFVLRPPAHLKENRQAADYYARASEILVAKLAGSNFYNRAFEAYLERGAYGIAAVECTAGANGRGLHFKTHPIGTYAIAENSLDEVDTVFRSSYRSPAQLIEQYGEEGNIPQEVRNKYEEPATRHQPSEEIICAILPRKDRDPRALDARNKPIASYHIHRTSAALLYESGYDSMPIAVSRWQTNPLSPYGWGPADYALPEAAQANFQEQMLDVLAEVAAFPRVLYPAGMKDEIDFSAMGLTAFDPQAGETAVPREWLTAGRYDIGKDRAADKKRAIESAFFTQLFEGVSRLSPDATATQVAAIVNESRELFHPIYSNMVREFLTPILRRSFTLLLLQGEMPPPPAEVIEQDSLSAFIADPEVEYVSAMSMALEASHMQSFQDILNTLVPIASLDPSFLQFLNPDTIGASMLRLKGLPTAWLRSEEDLAALRQAAAQAAQAQQAVQLSQGVKNLGGIDDATRAARMVEANAPE